MQAGHPSRTALGAARHRAAHQVLERGFIFSDPFALPILGIGADAIVQDTQGDEFTRKLRLFIAIRSRLAEDALAMAVARGVRQLVILGAGLDTYAYRNPFGNTLRIFEVDYPATQVWKREVKGRRVVSHGSLEKGDQRPLNGDMLFEIGSITKVFTALLAADMARRGEIRLDDPIAKYLAPDIKLPVRAGRQITFVDLATHTRAAIRGRSRPRPDHGTRLGFALASRCRRLALHYQ
jgi:hypothetical protein